MRVIEVWKSNPKEDARAHLLGLNDPVVTEAIALADKTSPDTFDEDILKAMELGLEAAFAFVLIACRADVRLTLTDGFARWCALPEVTSIVLS